MTRTKVTNSSLAFDGGPLSGFRNVIINGNFDVWQRGISFGTLASGDYYADRYFTIFTGGGTRTISRQLFTPGQTDVPGEPRYYLNWNQTVGGSGATANDIRQRIESVRTLSGQQATISFYAKAATNVTMPALQINQYFGTGGSPSASAAINIANNFAITTSWQRISYTFTVPSISGKTLGTDNNDYSEIIIRMPLNSTFNIDIAQIQFERGPIATPFENRLAGTELALCQRYYQEIGSNGADNGIVYLRTTTAVNNYQAIIPLTVSMRINPNITTLTVSPDNILHKPFVRWDTINAISWNGRPIPTEPSLVSYIFSQISPTTNDAGSDGVILYGQRVFASAEL